MEKVTAGVPDQGDGAQRSSSDKAATCRGRLLEADHQHVGVKLHQDGALGAEEERRQGTATLRASLRTIWREG